MNLAVRTCARATGSTGFVQIAMEVVQVYGVCICTLYLLVISITIQSELCGCHSKLCLCKRPILQDNVYIRWSRVHTAAVNRAHLEASKIVEIQAPVVHERRVLLRLDLHQIKDLFLCFLKISIIIIMMG